MKIPTNRVRDLFKFLQERHRIHERRYSGQPKPWTKNPILRDYRFTENYREWDKTTIWLRKHWREPHKNDRLCWFAMAVARYINWPPTLEAIGYPVPWNRARVVKILDDIRTGQGERWLKCVSPATLKLFPGENSQVFGRSYKIDAGQSRQIFGGAYFLNSIGPKIQSVVNDRLHLLWVNRKRITEELYACKSLAELYEVVRAQYGFGTFMAAQLIAELKYLPPWGPKCMLDWWTWAASGPGSRLGMGYLLSTDGSKSKSVTREAEWYKLLLELDKWLAPMFKKAKMPRAHMQDTQGFLCEYAKHEKMRLGHGRPKQKFKGAA